MGVNSATSYSAIGDYAVIGDTRTAALVSSSGSVDWCCLPRYDGDAVFGALLDARRGGRFSIQPEADFEVQRRYLPGTNVLETTFRTSTGSCVLRDLFTLSEGEAALAPEHELLREVRGLDGAVSLQVTYEPRRDYGRAPVHIDDRGVLGLTCEIGGAALTLSCDAPLASNREGTRASGRLRVETGEVHYWSLVYDVEAPSVIPPLADAAAMRLETTASIWREWSDQCTYEGPYRDHVVRSALALKLLTYAPSSAVVAAPTTSLPERIGGDSNWDYRYCWLRDAAFTVRALLRLGYQAEALAFAQWMLHATSLTRPELQVVYDVFGEPRLPERTLDHLEGYRGSRPVRVGNGADGQTQVDVYGEVVRSFVHCLDVAVPLASGADQFLKELGEAICRLWDQPDNGIWESRGSRAHHTFSMALCATALQDLVRISQQHSLDLPVERYRTVAGHIRDRIETEGFNVELQSYTAELGGTTVDASLLALPLYDYIDARAPRMQTTFQRIREVLAHGSLYLRTEPASLDGGEGAFAMCGFWAVELLALSGEIEAATEAFEELLAYANDVGLFAEEIDPTTGEALGNMPQGFTHVAVINAACTLAAVGSGERTRS